MQLSTIRYFYEVSRTESIRVAAERLHIAPSAVSRQIAQLEDELGHALFERRSTGLQLTLAGKIASEHFRRILVNVDAVRESLDELKDLRRGLIRIATVEGVVAHLLSLAIHDFHSSYPEVRFEVTIAGTAAVVKAVLQGNADLFIAFNVPPESDIKIVAQALEPLYVVVAADHRLSRADGIGLADLAKERLGVLTGEHGIRMLLDNAFSRVGLVPQYTIVSNSIEALKTFVSQGTCITLMPRFAAQREVDAGLLRLVSVRELELITAPLMIGMWRDQPPSRSTLELIERIERLLYGSAAKDS